MGIVLSLSTPVKGDSRKKHFLMAVHLSFDDPGRVGSVLFAKARFGDLLRPAKKLDILEHPLEG